MTTVLEPDARPTVAIIFLPELGMPATDPCRLRTAVIRQGGRLRLLMDHRFVGAMLDTMTEDEREDYLSDEWQVKR